MVEQSMGLDSQTMEGRLPVNLPTSVAAEIVSTWLSSGDEVRLDSAFCHSSLRNDFLNLIRSLECPFRSWLFDGKTSKSTDHTVRWAGLRGVVVQKLSLAEGSNMETYNEYMRKFGSEVLSLKVRGLPLISLTEWISQCCNLLVLDLYICELPFTLREVFANCKNLHTFRYHSPFRYGPEANDPTENVLKISHLEGIVCPNLKHMKIGSQLDDDVMIGTLVAMAVNVETVNIFCDIDTPIEYISPTITALSITEMTDLSQTVFNFVKRLTNLEHVYFEECEVNVAMVESLGTNLKQLKSVGLVRTRLTGGNVVAKLAELCGGQITELLLFQSTGLSVRDVQNVLPRFTHLTSFSMHYDTMEDEANTFDLSLLSRFTKLSLEYDGDAGAQFVQKVALHCAANLQQCSLYVSDDDNFCPSDFDVLMEKCTKLRSFEYQTDFESFCGPADVARWRSLRPNLSVAKMFDDTLSVFSKLQDRELFNY